MNIPGHKGGRRAHLWGRRIEPGKGAPVPGLGKYFIVRQYLHRGKTSTVTDESMTCARCDDQGCQEDADAGLPAPP